MRERARNGRARPDKRAVRLAGGAVRGWSGLKVFATVLGAYLALCIVGVFLMASGGLGPDSDPGIVARGMGRIGSGLLGLLLLPVVAIHGRFFMGQSLPGSDRLWIIGVGSTYAGIVALAHTLWKRRHRDPR